MGPIVIADIDQVNMFGNAEWHSIRESMDQELTEIVSWTNWLHRQSTEVVLPSGETVQTGQGRATLSARTRPLRRRQGVALGGPRMPVEERSKVHATSGTLTMGNSSSSPLCWTHGCELSTMPSHPTPAIHSPLTRSRARQLAHLSSTTVSVGIFHPVPRTVPTSSRPARQFLAPAPFIRFRILTTLTSC